MSYYKLIPSVATVPVLTKATSSPCSVAGLRHSLIDYASSSLDLRKDDFKDFSLTKNRHTSGLSADKLT